MFRPGELFTRSTAISDADAREAAILSQDTQPVHLDAGYAARTRFGKPIAPGALILSRVAGLLGTGLIDVRTHYIVTQQFSAQFLRPVVVGDELLMSATISAWNENSGRLGVSIEVRNQRHRRVLVGTADLIVFVLAEREGAPIEPAATQPV